MNLFDHVLEYITPALGVVVPCMGEWEDGVDEGGVEFLSINLEGAPRPGVISQVSYVDFWYVSKRDQADMTGGKKSAMDVALGIMQYIQDHQSSSCFVNVIPITGIIGPKATEQKRLAFKFTVEFTS